jgi:hypothetical protein
LVAAFLAGAFFAAAFLGAAFFGAAFLAAFLGAAFFADFFAAALSSPESGDRVGRVEQPDDLDRSREDGKCFADAHKLQSHLGRAIVDLSFSL